MLLNLWRITIVDTGNFLPFLGRWPPDVLVRMSVCGTDLDHLEELDMVVTVSRAENYSSVAENIPRIYILYILENILLQFSRASKGTFHQRRSSLNQVHIWTWSRFSGLCCTNAVHIKSRVKLGLTLKRRWRRIILWSSVQLALPWSLPSLSQLVQVDDD